MYVVAPDGDIVKDWPVQITPEFTVMVGVVFTVAITAVLGDEVQPAFVAST